MARGCISLRSHFHKPYWWDLQALGAACSPHPHCIMPKHPLHCTRHLPAALCARWLLSMPPHCTMHSPAAALHALQLLHHTQANFPQHHAPGHLNSPLAFWLASTEGSQHWISWAPSTDSSFVLHRPTPWAKGSNKKPEGGRVWSPELLLWAGRSPRAPV